MADKTEGLDPLLISGGTDPVLLDNKMKLLCRQVIECLKVSHYLGADGGEGIGYNEAAAGEMLGLIMHAQASPGAVEADKAALFVKTVADAAELFFMDEGEKEIRITKFLADLTSPLQSLNLDIGALSNDTPLKALNPAGTALLDLIKMGRNVADDADVTMLPDSARLDTDAAPVESTDISNKKYVDDGNPYIKLVDSKSAGTPGGTFTAGDWQKRTVAEETDTKDNVSVDSSVITLEAGTYECRISSTAYKVSRHKLRLRNTTANTTILVGTSESANNVNTVSNRSFVVGRFTITADQDVEIQHYCGETVETNGFGIESNFGEVEIYTIAEFWKRS
jgi:hypothetical protein